MGDAKSMMKELRTVNGNSPITSPLLAKSPLKGRCWSWLKTYRASLSIGLGLAGVAACFSLLFVGPKKVRTVHTIENGVTFMGAVISIGILAYGLLRCRRQSRDAALEGGCR